MAEQNVTERAGMVRQISPRTAGIAIVVVAMLGGAGVFWAGSVLHARDRERLATWEGAALPLVQRAEQIHAQMPAVARSIARAPSGRAGRAGELARRVQAFRTELQRIRARLEGQRLPDILVNVGTASYSGVGRSLESVVYLERALAAVPRNDAQIERFQASWDRAAERFALGKRLHVRVRCRARVDGCETVPFAPRAP